MRPSTAPSTAAGARKQTHAEEPTTTRPLNAGGEELAAEIIQAWQSFRNAANSGDKTVLRDAHMRAKAVDTSIDYEEVTNEFRRLRRFFRQPQEINPDRIEPEMRLVRPNSLEERLFKICRAFWSMPYSKGYGRRLRYVVFDRRHEGVIGIIGLHSAPADLACRDKYLGIPKGSPEKLDLINSTLDAYTLGAVPPYAGLLGGKLIAGLVATDTIRRDYWRTYGKRKTLLNGKRLQQPLIAVTTSSAFGRSSIYNRLKFDDRLLAKPLGYTKGFGTVHLEALYPKIESWLKGADLHVPAGFGNGPKVRWQNVMRAITALGLPRECLQHGLMREVFIFEHASNVQAVCQDGELANPLLLDEGDWGNYWRERYAGPRSIRDRSWKVVDAHQSLSDGIRNPSLSA